MVTVTVRDVASTVSSWRKRCNMMIATLNETHIYQGDNGRLMCSECAGSSALYHGRDKSGAYVIPMQPNEDGPMQCECGKISYGKPVSSGKKRMTVSVTQKVTIDPEAWALTFGLSRQEVREDVKPYFDGWCQAQVEKLDLQAIAKF